MKQDKQFSQRTSLTQGKSKAQTFSNESQKSARSVRGKNTLVKGIVHPKLNLFTNIFFSSYIKNQWGPMLFATPKKDSELG